MDGLTLLQSARDAGLRVEAAGDKLLIRGPKHAEPVVRLIAEHKAMVLAALAMPGAVALPYEDEPGSEHPCVTRRGKVEARANGMFLHYCVVCGRWGGFGCGVNLRGGRLGRWYCAAHRPKGEKP
jgi:hypothetical protein